MMNYTLNLCSFINIDVILMCFKLFYLLSCYYSCFFLGSCKSYPNSSQKLSFVDFREDFFHFFRAIAPGKRTDIRIMVVEICHIISP